MRGNGLRILDFPGFGFGQLAGLGASKDTDRMASAAARGQLPMLGRIARSKIAASVLSRASIMICTSIIQTSGKLYCRV